LAQTKRRYPLHDGNSSKRPDTIHTEISSRSERHGSQAARSFKRGPSKGYWDPVLIRSNTFEMEWPPRSGRRRTFPEIDRAAWFGIADARRRILKGQTVFIDRLVEARSIARNFGSCRSRAPLFSTISPAGEIGSVVWLRSAGFSSEPLS
jgi:hypothetical protein